MIVKDQLGIDHEFSFAPKRIVSLVPSITELICDLGLQDSLVGCTKFCVHPQGLKKAVMVVGGTKSVQYKRVADAAPDIIIGNKEENRKEDTLALADIAPVWVSDIATVDDSLEMVKSLGHIFDVAATASRIINETKEILSNFPKLTGSVAYLIWQNPFMTVGGDTYIHDMLYRLGLTNVFGEKTRYPELTIDSLRASSPDFVFLSSEPFPFKKQHFDEISNLLKDSAVIFVDGEFFSWYGTRLRYVQEYAKTLHTNISEKRSLS